MTVAHLAAEVERIELPAATEQNAVLRICSIAPPTPKPKNTGAGSTARKCQRSVKTDCQLKGRARADHLSRSEEVRRRPAWICFLPRRDNPDATLGAAFIAASATSVRKL
jgi:hypothetical protein